MENPKKKLLPDNAYTKLAPGEVYNPIVGADDKRAEITKFSIGLGLVMTVIFAAACIYMALRAGNAIEAAIPIAIMAIFFGKFKNSTILENVMVQSVGQAAGVVAAGAAFIIPALYINSVDPATGKHLYEIHWWHIFLSTFIGGTLGIVLIIPLRKYFVKDLHGELPFPEATAINEILVSGESASKSTGKVLLASFSLGAIYDFLAEVVSLWNPVITMKSILGSAGEKLAAMRLELSMNGLAALFGLGYIIGLKYAAIIAAGSVLAYLVMVPLVYLFGSQVGEFTYAGATYQIANMTASQIFGAFVKPIGIGAIATSGVIGIIRMGKIVISSVTLGFKGLKGGNKEAEQAVPRTERDLHPRTVLLMQAGAALLMALVFFGIAFNTIDSATGATYTLGSSLIFALIGAGVGFLLSFLFTPVAAQAIAIVGSNPVSGMTLITVVLTIVALVAVGASGAGGMVIALIAGCAVCTALSTSGALVTDFKIGYWIGSTPRNQQLWKFLGVAVAALVVSFVIPIMDSGYHFVVQSGGQWVSNAAVLPAPQANMIAAVSQGLLSDPANQPWLLYVLGCIMAIVLYMAGVPMLAFALGMYLPISINIPVLLGAFCAYLVGKSGKTEEVKKARAEQGTLIASGMMAGAAIFGIVGAILRQPGLGAPIQYISVGQTHKLLTDTITGETFLESAEQAWFSGAAGQWISLVMFVVLALACAALAAWGAKQTLSEAHDKQ